MDATKRRLHYIDWLKVLVVLGIFYYHASMPFVYASWMIQNPQKSALLSIYAVVGYQFGIPLLFLLAGADGWLSLGARTPSAYVLERVKRLLVPLVLGILILSPPQSYLMAVSGGYRGSFIQYVPEFFHGIQRPTGPTWLGAYGYHLWFLGFLFAYAVLATPGLTWLRAHPASLAQLQRWVGRPGGPLLLGLPLVACQLLLRASFPAYQDWSDACLWLACYGVGAVLVSDPRYMAAVESQVGREGLWTLAAGLVLAALAATGLVAGWEAHPAYTPGYLLYIGLRTAFAWGCVLLCLNLGLRWLDRGSRLLTRANEAVMPFYVIHHPVVVAMAFIAVQWETGVWPKQLFVVVSAFALTVAIYEVLVRPFDPVRRALGLKPRRRPGSPEGGSTSAYELRPDRSAASPL